MTSQQPYAGEPSRSESVASWPGEADSTAVIPKITDRPAQAELWSSAVVPDGDTVGRPDGAAVVLPDDAAATRIIPVFTDPAPAPLAEAARWLPYRRGRTVAVHHTKNVATRADAAGYIRFKLRERRRRIADRVRTMHARHGSRRLKVLSTLVAFVIVAAGVGLFWVFDPGKRTPTTANASTEWGGGAGGASYGNPFAGTPADGFAEGAAGIVPPAARAVAGWPSQRVSAALAVVTQALIETRVSPTLVRDHNPEKFLALVAPRQKDALQREFDNGQTAAYLSLLADGVTLISPPRAKGTFTYHATVNGQGANVLEITSNFVWAYAVGPTAQRPVASMIVVHDRIVWQVADPASVPATDAGLWLGDAESYAANVDCDEFAGGYLAPTPSTGGNSPVTSIPELYLPGATLTEPTC